MEHNPSRYYFPSLDLLRLFAFVLIFFHHLTLPESFISMFAAKVGWVGVDIFFCLSAFLLGRLLLQEKIENGKISLPGYFMRRILRIWPLYFTYLTFAVGIHLVFNENEINWARLGGLITFTDNLFAAFAGYNPMMFTAHLWTISFEEQFYVVLPFAIMLLSRLTRLQQLTMILGMWLIVMAVRLLMIRYQAPHPAIYTLPFSHSDPMFAGLLVAFSEKGKSSLAHLAFAALLLMVPLFLAYTTITGYHLMIIYPSVAAGSALLVRFCVYTKMEINSKNLFVYLGRISFGLYVFHIAIMNITAFLMDYRLPLLQALAGFAGTVACAHVSYWVLEKRFLELKRKFYPTHEKDHAVFS